MGLGSAGCPSRDLLVPSAPLSVFHVPLPWSQDLFASDYPALRPQLLCGLGFQAWSSSGALAAAELLGPIYSQIPFHRTKAGKNKFSILKTYTFFFLTQCRSSVISLLFI